MRHDRLLLDTFFVQALLNHRDQFHAQAVAFAPRLRLAAEVWITEAILVEIGNALSKINRVGAAQFVRQAYQTRNMHVVPVDTVLLSRAVDLYAARLDKDWGLTDCISFVVMHDQQIADAVTGDEHFRQAGFRALLLNP